jgi:flavin-dependent dehydrogenase
MLDASGRNAFLAGKLRLKRSNKRNSTGAVFAHFRNVKPRADQLTGYISIHLTKDGWCWIIPLPGGTMSVGFVGTAALFKHRREACRTFFNNDCVAVQPSARG